MDTFVIVQTVAYEISAPSAEEALTAYLEIEGNGRLLPLNVLARSVEDADGRTLIKEA